MPSFTCPDNHVHRHRVSGPSGNFYLDRSTIEPVVMTGSELLEVNSGMRACPRRLTHN